MKTTTCALCDLYCLKLSALKTYVFHSLKVAQQPSHWRAVERETKRKRITLFSVCTDAK